MIRLVMEQAGLTFWPLLSFGIFLTSSLAMVVWLYRPGSKAFYGDLARLVLDEDKVLKGKG